MDRAAGEKSRMKQITLLAGNKKDLIAEITRILADGGISLDSITGENYGEQAVVTITVDNYPEALRLIQSRKDFQVMSKDALLVRIEDEVGALARLSRRFADAGIDIQSIRFVERGEGSALVAISTPRTEEALALVHDIAVS